jgi:predicted membrane protein
MDEKFWIEDPSILYKNYYIIIPEKNMSRIQQLNTCTRFILYFIFLCILFGAEQNIIIYLLIGIILIVIFYYIYISDPIGIQNDLISEAEKSEKNFIENKETCKDCQENFELNKPIVTLYDSVKNKIFKGNEIPKVNFEVESGYIDSDGNYKIGPNYSDINYIEYTEKQKKEKEKKITWEKNELYKKDNGRKPTVENPFTNIVFSDYLDAPNLAEPCNIDDNNIAYEMQNLYNSSIYRNTSDVWERENSQRMFYSVPIQTIPNNQTDFANWLYKTGPSCHENTNYCTYNNNPSMTSQRY